MERTQPPRPWSRQMCRNVEAFSATRSIARYRQLATAGLFPQERTAIDRHFTRTGAAVLDAGCGTGRTTRPLADRGFDVVGVDAGAEMVRAAQTLHADLEVHVGDVADLPFESDAFDYALFSYNGLDYVHPAARRRRALRELRRVLVPGGRLVFSSHNSWYLLPALLADRRWVRKFYCHPENAGRLRSRYKVDTDAPTGLETYFTNPRAQRAQLRRAGFSLIDVIGKRRGLLGYVEIMPYYVARC